jgi:uncharacterized damage-inducible protein DinB
MSFVFTIDGIHKFHRWTHACLEIILDHLSTVPAGIYVKEVPGFGFSTLQRQLIHVFNCEGLWIHALQKLKYVDVEASECPDVSDVRALQQQVSDRTLAYLSNLTNQQLNSDAELQFPDGNLAIRTPALVLHHVLTHAFHHKGQIVTICRSLGYPAPDTDLNWFK